MDTRNFTFMFYGFLAAWGILFVYVIWIAARERRITTELRRLKAMIGEGERK
jgi:CcmD family protein